ncbi:hypothetical protein [Caulobacter hibisci]|uniref:Uncharacterized protein n=1 Tax=Caulobacter hibisci TaxID=2035993 RepID=A0ABS0SVY6_9CAUL|nr:hypothetical protein [Caulobacter hibisci]MBI1683764.1 hypothetical protein [Caulobacter hibisci]
MKFGDALPVLAAGVLATMASAAVACAAPTPKGDFSGPILDVPEAGVICVALGPTPDRWVRVRLAQPLERRALMAAGFSKRVTCRLDAAGEGRCQLGEQDLLALATSTPNRAQAVSWR